MPALLLWHQAPNLHIIYITHSVWPTKIHSTPSKLPASVLQSSDIKKKIKNLIKKDVCLQKAELWYMHMTAANFICKHTQGHKNTSRQNPRVNDKMGTLSVDPQSWL